MKWIALGICAFAYLLFGAALFAGDTYAAINSTGDYINYGPSGPPANHSAVIVGIVVAPDSTRYEPRWTATLDPNDLRDLVFIQAQQSANLVIHSRP